MLDEYDEQGQRIKDDIVLLLINGHWQSIDFTLPGKHGETGWEMLVDSNFGKPDESTRDETGDKRRLECGEIFKLEARSLVLLRQPKIEKHFLD